MFRILQESLTNIVRHAGATVVQVRVSCEADRVVLEVADDGRGITESEAENSTSFGVLGMRERARMFGGVVRIQGGDPRGTTVRVSLPC